MFSIMNKEYVLSGLLLKCLRHITPLITFMIMRVICRLHTQIIDISVHLFCHKFYSIVAFAIILSPIYTWLRL